MRSHGLILLITTLSFFIGFRAGANTAICQSYLLAADQIAALQAGIDTLSKEFEAAKTRVWTPAQIKEIRDFSGLSAKMPEHDVTKFYQTHVERSLKRMKTEQNWYRANAILAQIQKDGAGASELDSVKALNFIRALLDNTKLDMVTFGQLQALFELSEIRRKMPDLNRKIDTLTPRSWMTYPDPVQQAKDLAVAQAQLAEMEKREQELLQEYFVDTLFGNEAIIRAIVWANERSSPENCCGSWCPSCPLQRGNASFEVENPSQFKVATLALYEISPYFEGLIPMTFSSYDFNTGELVRIQKRPKKDGHVHDAREIESLKSSLRR